MNILPLAVLWWLSRKKGASHHPAHRATHHAAHTAKHGPKWPSPKDPPPKRAPARHTAPAPHKAPHRKPQPAHHEPTLHDHNDIGPTITHKPVQREHVEHTVVHDQPHVVHHAPIHHASSPVHDAQTQLLSDLHNEPPAPATAANDVEQHAHDGEYPIAHLQKILVGLGWRGDNTTSGPIVPALKDGLYGPVTHGDWQRSAVKRNLDPSFDRVSSTVARVDPDTYATLKALAVSKGAVVGARRRMYIP